MAFPIVLVALVGNLEVAGQLLPVQEEISMTKKNIKIKMCLYQKHRVDEKYCYVL